MAKLINQTVVDDIWEVSLYTSEFTIAGAFVNLFCLNAKGQATLEPVKDSPRLRYTYRSGVKVPRKVETFAEGMMIGFRSNRKGV